MENKVYLLRPCWGLSFWANKFDCGKPYKMIFWKNKNFFWGAGV